MEEGINVVSCFDGMACLMIALKRLGIKVNKYFAYEIDKYAIQVAKANFPEIIELGDIRNVSLDDFGGLPIHLVAGGSPCQGFSFSGKQLNFNDPRSALFFEFVRIKNMINPQYFLLENVVMKKEYENVITEHMEVNPILINSALVSAQNRKRLYWTNIPNIEQPEDRGVTWGDVREHGVNTETYYYTEKALQWLARSSRKRAKVLSVHREDEKMQMLEASHHKKYSNQRFFGIVDLPSDSQTVAAMRGRYLVNGKRQDGKQLTKGLTEQYIEFRYDGKTNALTTVGKDNIVVPFTLPNRVPVDEFFFRYITPIECERLQTVPDNFTSMVSDSQRYKMLGNGWTIDIIVHILKNMQL